MPRNVLAEMDCVLGILKEEMEEQVGRGSFASVSEPAHLFSFGLMHICFIS